MRPGPTRTLAVLVPMALSALVGGVLAGGAAHAIVGGQVDGNAHPMVGLMVAQDETGTPLWRCSGTLISATDFITAGHCTSDEEGGSVAEVEVFFDDDLDANPEFLAALEAEDPTPCTDDSLQRLSGYPCDGDVSGTAYTHPDYDPADFTLHDLGAVVLERPWELGVYAELPEPGAFDTWKSNDDRSFTAVGYGVQKQYGAGASGRVATDNKRRFAHTRLKSINKNKNGDRTFLLSNNSKGGTCTGDSGGPNFMDDSLVIAGVTSFGVSQNTCGGQGGAYRLDQADDRAWLSDTLGGEPGS